MITDIPAPDDFFCSGWRFLDYGWSQAIELLIDIRIQEDELQPDSTDIHEFWELGRHNLITSLALVQQGIELLLKGCIAEVSPYLLITQPQQWPGKCDKNDTFFSQFRTIDAQDLIKVYDTVRENRLSENFKGRVDELRKHRNMTFHGINKSTIVEASEVLRAVFEAVENLNSGKRWLEVHKNFLENTPISRINDIDYSVKYRMMKEMEIIVQNLKPEEVEKYTGFRVKEKSYKCPWCGRVARKYGGEPKFVQERVDKDGITKSLYCFCCCENIETIKADCQSPDCDSTFLDEDGVCLICDHENELDN
ncbi:hypothetical protein WJM97_22065 [Okeanomitos corallinicola TIOX110]|uniref:HEPN AbiU2-like domain-containing protein n=1 Tax=Okeanomitos corallinicola TIOX110 TaxID=3133117 RepID=A0ABZ2USC0_9CYAN